MAGQTTSHFFVSARDGNLKQGQDDIIVWNYVVGSCIVSI